jgi:hypothetical protein
LEQLVKKYEGFHWNSICDKSFDTLKEKLSISPILTFPNWSMEFHVHIDASNIVLGAILMQHREGKIDHPIYFSNRKLSQVERNYAMTEREGLDMVYSLQKFDIIC